MSKYPNLMLDDCPNAPGSHCTHWDNGMETCCECDTVCWIEPTLVDRVLRYVNDDDPKDQT